MKSMTRSWVLVLLACGCMMAACDQDSGSADTTTETTSDPVTETTSDVEPEVADDPVPETTETYSVSGTVSRDVATCPPAGDASGPLCLSFRTDCTDAGSEVVAATTASVALSMPGTVGNWTATDIPVGSFQLYAFLDDDGSGCDALTSGDFFSGDGCVAVDVVDADVTGVTLFFNNKQP